MIITKTPLRVSFFGGGTDFPDHYNQHGGAWLSAAINRYICVWVNNRYDGKTAVNYRHYEQVDDPKDIQHDLIRATNEYLKRYLFTDPTGTETTTIAEITGNGSGLGSSSSLTAGYILAQFPKAMKSTIVTASNFIEVLMMEKPQGIQDVYPAVYGGLNLYQVDTSGDVTITNIPEGHHTLFSHLLMFDIGQRPEPSKYILREQKERTKGNIDILLQLQSMAVKASDLITAGQYEKFGYLLDEGWQLKKKLSSQISGSRIDRIYNKAKEAGALGGKVCGAGGGGFMILYCPFDKMVAIREAMEPYQELTEVRVSKEGAKVIYES